jgi:hypothetical protein
MWMSAIKINVYLTLRPTPCKLQIVFGRLLGGFQQRSILLIILTSFMALQIDLYWTIAGLNVAYTPEMVLEGGMSHHGPSVAINLV